MDMGIFPLLVQHAHSGLSATELTGHTGAERALIGTIPTSFQVMTGVRFNNHSATHESHGSARVVRQSLDRGVPAE